MSSNSNAFCRQFLDSLQLDPAKIRPEVEKLPDQLLEKCAELSVKPDAIKDLVSAMQSKMGYIRVYISTNAAVSSVTGLSNVATDVESNIKEIIAMLDEEEKQEAEFQVCSSLVRRQL